ncbi:MAG: DMT family transporter [Moraxellaceae bacterium]|nr:DMT family transporter [Moraxellaceae bacterium]
MFYIFLASILWGTSFIAGKYAEDFTSPELVVLLRLVLASLCIAHVAIPVLKRLSNPLLKRVIFVSFLTFPVTFLLQFIGLKYTTASNAATMIGFMPLTVLLSEHFFFGKKATIKQLLLSVIAFIGVLLVMGKPDLANDNFIGCLIVLLSDFVVAIWLPMSKKLISAVPAGSYTPLTLFFGAITSIPTVIILTPFLQTDWTIMPSMAGIISVVYLGIGCSLVASWAWNRGVALVDTHVSGLALALEPVFGVIFAILLLGDRPNIYAMTGIFLVIMTVLLSLKLK